MASGLNEEIDFDFFCTPRNEETKESESNSNSNAVAEPSSQFGDHDNDRKQMVDKSHVEADSDPSTTGSASGKHVKSKKGMVVNGHKEGTAPQSIPRSKDRKSARLVEKRRLSAHQRKTRHKNSERNAYSSDSDSDADNVVSTRSSILSQSSKPVSTPSMSKRQKSGSIESTESDEKSRSDSELSSDSESESESLSESSSDTMLSSSDSESDMTDVSPLSSPNASPSHSPVMKRKLTTNKVRIKSPERVEVPDNEQPHPAAKETGVSSRKDKPLSSKSKSNLHTGNFMSSDNDTVNLQLLMQAVLELDKSGTFRNGSQPSSRSSISQTSSHSTARKNHSFTNDQVNSIDRENRRLLKAIIDKAPNRHYTSRLTSASHHRHVVSSSTINRHREHRRIEQDNRALLKRLEDVRSTKQLTKSELEREFVSKHVNHHRNKGRASVPNSATPSRVMTPIGTRSQSMTSLRSASSTVCGSQSASVSRPRRASARPDWNSRFHVAL